MKTRLLIISILLILILSACNIEGAPSTAPLGEAPLVEAPLAEAPDAEAPAALPTQTTAAAEPAAPAEPAMDPNVEPVVEPAQEATREVFSDEAFQLQLANTIESKDLGTLKFMMGERFSFLSWNTELLEVSNTEAMERLSGELLVSGAEPAVIFGTDLAALLGGEDPLAQWGPIANAVRGMHVMGLGPNATNEAVFMTGRDANGYYYLHGVILPPGGYFQMYDQDDRVVQTDVKYVMANTNVRLRTGPGFEYAQEGLVYEGQIARVTGLSKDGKWWRVSCDMDISGNCFMSADPELTTPTHQP
jgi:uncharacterized protein YgiM (DUF1202 family)